jgi:hypothetical protein
MVGGLFKLGIVELPGELPEAVQEEIMAARGRVVRGQPLGGEDEDTLLFAPFLQDLMKDDDERFGGKGGGDGTV